MKIKCIVVDDEQFARKLLTAYIEKIPMLELVGTYKNALLAMDALAQETVHLMFLDIQMPQLKGTDFLRLLNNKPLVIFTTAYTEYALEGYELEVLDYLIKPIPFDRFLQAVSKATKRLNETKEVESVPTLPIKDFLVLKSGQTTHKLFFKDIYYIEALKEYVTYHTVKGRIVMLQSLKKLEKSLPASNFMRVHRSYMVNLGYASTMTGNSLIIKEQVIPIGKTYLEEVRKQIFL